MKKETIAKSAKTGRIVSKEFAKANPDTTFETVKSKRKPKEVAPPIVEDVAEDAVDTSVLVDKLAIIGVECIFTKGEESFVGVIESLDPLRVVKYEVKENVVSSKEIDVALEDYIITVDVDEAFRRLAN